MGRKYVVTQKNLELLLCKCGYTEKEHNMQFYLIAITNKQKNKRETTLLKISVTISGGHNLSH